MAYPSAYQVGQGVWNSNPISSDISDLTVFSPKPVTQLSVVPRCDTNGCDLIVLFKYLSPSDYHHLVVLARPASQSTCGKLCLYSDGYLTITYVAYCSTQPIPSDAGKHEPEQTKLK